MLQVIQPHIEPMNFCEQGVSEFKDYQTCQSSEETQQVFLYPEELDIFFSQWNNIQLKKKEFLKQYYSKSKLHENDNQTSKDDDLEIEKYLNQEQDLKNNDVDYFENFEPVSPVIKDLNQQEKEILAKSRKSSFQQIQSDFIDYQVQNQNQINLIEKIQKETVPDEYSLIDNQFYEPINSYQQSENGGRSTRYSSEDLESILSFTEPQCNNVLNDISGIINQVEQNNYQQKEKIVEQVFKIQPKKVAKGNKQYSKQDRIEVKKVYQTYLNNFLQLGNSIKESTKLAKACLSQNKQFQHISRQLKNHWIKKLNTQDLRKNNKGKKGEIYEKFNIDLLRELPKRMFNCSQKTFFKTTIYNQIALDLYKENQSKYSKDLAYKQVFPENGKRKVLTKCWFEGFAKKYDFNFQNVKKRRVEGKTQVTQISIDGKTYKREDYM